MQNFATALFGNSYYWVNLFMVDKIPLASPADVDRLEFGEKINPVKLNASRYLP